MTRQCPQSRPIHASLRQIIAQGRKRIGLLVGAGAPAGIFPPGSDEPLIPAVAGLTDMVMEVLKPGYGKTFGAVDTWPILLGQYSLDEMKKPPLCEQGRL